MGTLWFYPNGMANILSQHRMVVHSGWDVDYSTKLYRKSGNIQDLKYDCVTSNGVNVTFTPNKQGLHVFDCRKYFSLGQSGCVFGETIIDNDTNNGLFMYHTITSIGVNNEIAIDTAEESKNNIFTMRD